MKKAGSSENCLRVGRNSPVPCHAVDEPIETTGISSRAERTCYRHPDRRGGVTCQRCDKPICPQCMHQASVGFHCPGCAQTGSQSIVSKPKSRPTPEDEPSWATRILIGLNFAGFLYSIVTGGALFSLGRSSALADGGLFARIPVGSPSDGLSFIGVDTGEYYRLVTSAFLHDGLFHLAFNLYALWLLGQLLDSAYGWMRFVSIYVVSLLGGSLGVMLIDPNAVTVGASGAIFGMLGAMMVVQRAVGTRLWQSPLGILLIINLALTLLVPIVSVGGHFGGLFAGLVMGWVTLQFEIRDVKRWATILVAACFSGLLVTASVAAASHWSDPVLSMFAGF